VDAFRKAHLLYRPSELDDEALETLLKNDFVPVYVRAANTGKEEFDLKSLKLTLEAPGQSLAAIANYDLPDVFEEINWPAVIANVYNVTAVVTVCTGIIVASLYAQGDMSPLTMGWEGDSKVINPVKKTKELDYSDYLLPRRGLAHREKTGGLVFFKLESGVVDWSELRVRASLSGF